MFRRIVLSAILSGLVAGALITAVQWFALLPMIAQAETYETASPAAGHAGHDGGHGHSHGHGHGHSHDADEWMPADGMERNLYTLLTNALAAIGFGLLLTACYALRGSGVNWRSGMLWGLGGFAAFQLAPALGLPPELPGSAAAELSARQTWWIITVTASAAGLGLLVFGQALLLRLMGLAFIAAPHLFGAPQAALHTSAVPEALVTEFIIRTLLLGAVFWVMLGALSGYSFQRLKRGAP